MYPNACSAHLSTEFAYSVEMFSSRATSEARSGPRLPWTKFDRQDDFDDPAKLGFEFSLAQIEVRAIDLQPDLFADWGPDADSEAA